jgi:hypothetical protein
MSGQGSHAASLGAIPRLPHWDWDFTGMALLGPVSRIERVVSAAQSSFLK